MRFCLFAAVALFVVGMAGIASARVDAPEVDPGSASSALAFLIGGGLLLREKMRRRLG